MLFISMETTILISFLIINKFNKWLIPGPQNAQVALSMSLSIINVTTYVSAFHT
jgi:hypothetical protein